MCQCFSVGLASAATVCPDGWVGHDLSCYFFAPTRVQFMEAEVQSFYFTFFHCSLSMFNRVLGICIVFCTFMFCFDKKQKCFFFHLQKFCINRGSKMVEISDAAENAFLKSQIASHARTAFYLYLPNGHRVRKRS